jgi:iron complex outermembrane recepter protein
MEDANASQPAGCLDDENRGDWAPIRGSRGAISRRRPRFPSRGAKLVVAASTLAVAMGRAYGDEPAFASSLTDGSTPALEEIVVTGSRLPSRSEASIAPVQVIGGESLEARGQINVATLLQGLPASGGFQQDGGDQLTNRANAGISTVNLRGLGDSRTLVLVDGRRFVPGTPGSSSVDLNTIPTDLIDRVEVLTGGASAVYGSDAVAGVVNIITRKDIHGIALNAQLGADQHGEGLQRKISALTGGRFADDRGAAQLVVEYDNTDAISALQRGFSKDLYVVSNPNRPDLGLFGPSAYSNTRTALGVFALNANTVGAGSLNRTVLPDGTVTTALGSRDGINNQDYYQLAMPMERFMGATRFQYDLTPATQLFANALLSRSKSLAQYNPTYIITGSVNLGGTGASSIPLSIPVDNPFIPAAMRALIPAGQTSIAISRDLPEFGARQFFYDRKNAELTVGLMGKFDSPFSQQSWDWQTYYEYGRSDQDVSGKGGYNTELMYQSQRVTHNASGALQCADPVARAQGCIPIDLFTGNPLTPAEIASVAANFTQQTAIVQQVADASLTGGLLDLPAGRVDFAMGAEWRKESSDYSPDNLFQEGFSSLGYLSATRGEFDVKELFGEARAPLLRNLGPVTLVEMEGALRWADYSTTGSANTWKLGGSMTLLSDLRFRAEESRAVRAPNIGELYAGVSSSLNSVIDPCVSGGATPARQKYCLSAPGITTAFSPPSPYSVTNTSGGNPGLRPEHADTLTFGMTYSPRQVDGLAVSVDYYRIDLKDAITTLDRQTVLNECADTADPRFCSLIHRNPSTGYIQLLDLLPINAARLETEGLDVMVNLRHSLGSWGAFTTQLAYTHLISFESIAFGGAAPQQFVGRPTYPADDAMLNATYDYGSLTLNLAERYHGEAFRVVGAAFAGNRVAPIAYTDLQVLYAFTPKLTTYVGVQNLFDAQPPLYAGTYQDGQLSTNTPFGYDVIGRFLYAGVKWKY